VVAANAMASRRAYRGPHSSGASGAEPGPVKARDASGFQCGCRVLRTELRRDTVQSMELLRVCLWIWYGEAALTATDLRVVVGPAAAVVIAPASTSVVTCFRDPLQALPSFGSVRSVTTRSPLPGGFKGGTSPTLPCTRHDLPRQQRVKMSPRKDWM